MLILVVISFPQKNNKMNKTQRKKKIKKIHNNQKENRLFNLLTNGLITIKDYHRRGGRRYQFMK